jgi:NAD(P)-dependent dehydrogenase (short-subunit alcohol dehydrogenase family)
MAVVEDHVSTSLAGRVIAVTGAAHGIGAATARMLAASGARLALADLDAPALETVRAGLAPGPQTIAHRVDIRKREEVEAFASQILGTWSRIDAAVHCAAVVHPGRFTDMDERALRCQLDSNIWGSVIVARAFLPVFLRQRSGHLVLVASLGGVVPMPGEAAYSMSKFAVRGLALSLALELRAAGVHVTSVTPDSARTAMLDIEAREDGPALSFSNPPLEPEDVARGIVAALRSPRPEILVPRARSWLVRLLAAFPPAFAPIFPLFDRAGRRRRLRYRAGLGPAPPLICHEP